MLFGVDDKVGIIEIMVVMNYLINYFEIKYGKICVVFILDEEIGWGLECFDVEVFGVKYVYIMDGGLFGELEYESFNVVGVKIIFNGNSVYFGIVKNKMVNVVKMVMEFNVYILKDEVFEYIEGYEGFYYLIFLNGDVE